MIRDKLTSRNLFIRILWLSLIFLITFFGVTVLSYYILPEGLLKSANTSRDFTISSDIRLAGIQIFLFNMMSVAVIAISSLFARKNGESKAYLSIGYSCFLVLVLINAVTLGTWSFITDVPSVGLVERITSMFRITEHAGLTEMFGQLLITCALADKHIFMIYKKQTIKRRIKDVPWKKEEIFCILLGFALMFIGAWVESRALINIG
ncbi:MAG: hypothetical protein GX222_08575 [Ruminococcaceae bacterium]|nr:hypothetical protein [Oscillospiraceae bacterium]